ncbi:hypothetical protein ABTL75_20205, partial [Acinetobacter baumannii]
PVGVLPAGGGHAQGAPGAPEEQGTGDSSWLFPSQGEAGGAPSSQLPGGLAEARGAPGPGRRATAGL